MIRINGVDRYPVDRVAERVTREAPKGDEVRPREDPSNPRLVAPPADMRRGLAPFGQTPDRLPWDALGYVTGLLTVVGWIPTPSRKPPHYRWVCRCQCGYYILRKTIREPKTNTYGRPAAPSSCNECRHKHNLRSGPKAERVPKNKATRRLLARKARNDAQGIGTRVDSRWEL